MASRSWNRAELIGNLTRDPELRYTPNGAAVCTFGMATNRTYVTEGERKEEVDFHKLVSWNKLAELCNQLLKKGMKVFISGRLQTRSWEGQDGQTRQSTEIVIEDMIILSPKNNSGVASSVSEDLDAEPVKVEEPKESNESDEPKVEEKKAEAKKESKSEESAPEKTLPQEEVKDDLPF